VDECDFVENAVDGCVVAGAGEDVDVAFYGVDVLPAVGKSKCDCVAACSGEYVDDGGFFWGTSFGQVGGYF